MAANSAPASGSASAAAVAMAAALVAKVATRSADLDDAAGMVERAESVRRRALELVEADHEAVTEMLARRSPGPAAIAVPREIGELAQTVQRMARALEIGGNPHLIADAIGARVLAGAAAQATQAILRSNSPLSQNYGEHR